MKSFSQARNPISEKSTTPRKHNKVFKENSDPNFGSPVVVAGKPSSAVKLRSPLPPRPPSSSSVMTKRKLCVEPVPENAGCSDSGVKVVVRMRPPSNDEQGGDLIAQKMSSDSLSIHGHTFTFDSVADTTSSQKDIFQLVGDPLVENCLAGFNSSVFAYGQTGSGKTYTMWGPANALLEENLSSEQQGLTPRVFERLFARINEEQIKHTEKQLIYQCRCSFLEIYNEQITDLLDSSQRNLQIREDVKSGVYVENLTEECVSTMKDVTQLLMKGLSNRRTGATTVNAESSRSHSVFTCVVESRCKSVADGLSSFKTSRINLVDLAGSERQKLTGAAGERLKEAGNINRSLSQLGNLINILAEVSQTGKHRHIPYRDSRLTFLLQESLGGNAKLAMVCAISPSQSCKSETLSTLRFAQRAKAIKNKAVVNEVMQDDVKFLRGVIRQLKDELLKMKENGTQTDPAGGYSTGWNARRSLNLLKFSLNRPMTLPHVDEDSDEEMEIVEEANQLLVQFGDNGSKSIADVSDLETEQGLKDTDVVMEEAEISEEVDKHGMISVDRGESVHTLECPEDHAVNHHNQSEGNYEDKCIYSQGKWVDKDSPGNQIQQRLSVSSTDVLDQETMRKSTVIVIPKDMLSPVNSSSENPDLSPSPCKVSPVLKSPTPSVSPRVNSSTKSLRTSSIRDENNFGPEPACSSFANASKGVSPHSTLRSTSCIPPTEHLAASLHKGLEIFESNRQSTALRRSSFRFSYKPADSKPFFPINKVDVGVQTLPQESEVVEEDSQFLCTKCKTLNYQEELKDADEISNLQLVPVAGSQSEEKTKMLVPKAVEKVLAGAIRREMALEEFCNKQNSEILQLNRLVQQYKHERECNLIIGQTREDKIARLESLMDGILTTEDFVEDELVSIKNEHKCLKEKYENHPEVLRAKLELKRVQDELDQYRSFFDMGERDVLLEEIQDLRSQLQHYVDSSGKSARIQSPLLQLTYPRETSEAPPTCMAAESTEKSLEERLEQERIFWEEAESKWISLAESLKIDLEASRSLSEKLKRELDSEKKCSEELKEAMQLAMEGHARMLEQYADLEERHMQLLARHRKIQEGIDDVKKAASRAGVRGAESKFINALAAEISALKVEREKERCYLRDENKGLQAQLRDTAEAVQAAGELLVRLKEAEEALAVFQNRAMEAEQETEKAYIHINKLKRKHEQEINSLNELLEESRSPAKRPAYDDSHAVKYDLDESPSKDDDQQWREEFQPFKNTEEGELSKFAEPSSWFSGYDRCNI